MIVASSLHPTMLLQLPLGDCPLNCRWEQQSQVSVNVALPEESQSLRCQSFPRLGIPA